jgi:hypothetical protein
LVAVGYSAYFLLTSGNKKYPKETCNPRPCIGPHKKSQSCTEVKIEGSVLYGEKISKFQWVAIILAVIGVSHEIWRLGSIPAKTRTSGNKKYPKETCNPRPCIGPHKKSQSCTFQWVAIILAVIGVSHEIWRLGSIAWETALVAVGYCKNNCYPLKF